MAKTHSNVVTETETVIKRILPYLVRRGYIVEEDLDFETPVKTPSKHAKGFADIIVNCGKAKAQFVIEAKRSSKKLTDKDREQAVEYGKGLGTLFVVLTNGIEFQSINVANGQNILWDGSISSKVPTKEQLPSVVTKLKSNKTLTNISLNSDETLPYKPGLPLKQLNGMFARCHGAIRKIEKNEDSAFSDFSKLLFLKLLEEKAEWSSDFSLPYSYRFHILAEKPDSESDQVQNSIHEMIRKIIDKTKYGEVLSEVISLQNSKTFHYIVRQLAEVSFQDCNLDSKGAAFEYFVRATLKGKKLGQYFTPRPLIELMAAIIGSDKIITSLQSGTSVKVLDPACGTGGFLVYLMQQGLKQAEALLNSKKITKKAYEDLIIRIKQNTFFGSDANKGVASSAKMNMIIAGDGHSNIQHEDSLSINARNWNVKNPTCDIIMTNPPFGTSESQSQTKQDASQFDIKVTKGQLLFIQKMVLSANQDADICTVIDEGVLNTDQARELRKWMLQRCKINAIVRLPEDTFRPNQINVRSSVIYATRLAHDDIDLAFKYKLKFIDVKSLGYDGSGDAIRGFTKELLFSEISDYVINGTKAKKKYNWESYEVDSQDVFADSTFRLDYKYWNPAVIAEINRIKRLGGALVKNINTIETRRGKGISSELYVGAKDGFAMVVKAGSGVSKFGKLLHADDYIEKVIFDEHEAFHLQKGDVLLSSTGDGTLGKCCVFSGDIPAVADSHITIIRPDQTIVSSEYLCDYLRAGFGKEQVDRLYTGSTGLIELARDQVDSIIIDTLQGNLKKQIEISKRLRSAEDKYSDALTSAETELTDQILKFKTGA